jgi:predicted AlkP superfamily pyrophosphatase or phosphodiesterase
MRLLVLLLCFSLITPIAARPQASPPYVAMISIDGLGPADYVDASRCGVGLRHLRELMEAGVYAEGVTGVLPTVTYPSHATLVTGVHPTTHSVVTNDRERDGAAWHLDRSDISTTTLWNAAEQAGLSVAIVTWPSTYGATVDYLVPENLAYSPVDDVAALIRAGSTAGLFDSLETATGRVTLLPFEHPDAGTPLDRMTASFAAEIVRRHQPNLLLLHFLDFDHRQHDHGPGSVEACRSVETIDSLLGEIRAAYRDAGLINHTSFVIVSDHGFFPVHTLVNANALMADGALAGRLKVRGQSGSAAFYPKDGEVVSPTTLAELQQRLERDYSGLFRWIAAEEAARLGGYPGAAFVLCASSGYAFTTSRAASDDTFLPSVSRGGHGYCPDEPGIEAAFIAGGPGIRPLGAIPRMRMIDIAPTVAALLGIDLPDAHGFALVGLLEPRETMLPR